MKVNFVPALLLCLVFCDILGFSLSTGVRERRRNCKRVCSDKKDKYSRKRCIKECKQKKEDDNRTDLFPSKQHHNGSLKKQEINIGEAVTVSSPTDSPSPLFGSPNKNAGNRESTIDETTSLYADDSEWILFSDDSQYFSEDLDDTKGGVIINDSVIINDTDQSTCPWHCEAPEYYGPWPGDVGPLNLSCIINATESGNNSVAIHVSWNQPTENFKYLHGYRIMWSTYTNILYCKCIFGEDKTHFTLYDRTDGWVYPGVVAFLVKPVPMPDFDYTEFTELNPLLNCTYHGIPEEAKSKSDIPSDKIFIAVIATLVGLIIVAALWALYSYFNPPKLQNRNNSSEILEISSGPQVYMMYYAKNERTKQQVADITAFLLDKGINAIMNLMHTAEMYEIPVQQWSCQQIEKADKVLVVVTPEFIRLCHRHDNNDIGKGVSAEQQRSFFEIGLLKNEQFQTSLLTTKFVLLKLTGSSVDLPYFLNHYRDQCFNWSSKDSRESLLRLLHHINEYAVSV